MKNLLKTALWISLSWIFVILSWIVFAQYVDVQQHPKLGTVATSITWDIRVSDISSATNECAVSTNKYYNYYLVGDKRIIPTDRFYQYSNDVKINTWQSLIKIWR